jgi:2-polyprenyl-3-methyl-5-hydroxy-6-metoxy-1,4-benzoquinol methylase
MTSIAPPEPAMSYGAKAAKYFEGCRSDFLDRLPINPQAALLEIGCGAGNTAASAKQLERCGFAAGIELFEDAGLAARDRLDEVVIGNVETVDVPWREETFDILILSEVLEHLTDPWTALRRLQPLMKPGCTVLASSPNMAHWHLIGELIAGDWKLADFGPKDRTHLRWFTPRSFRRLFTECGYCVKRVYPVRQYGWKGRLISKLSGGRLEHLFISGICIEATVER